MRNISAWSIRNPVFALVLFASLTFAGMVAFMRMDVNNSPEITFPGVIVEIAQPGAAPVEMETQIAQKVEAAVRNLEGVDEIETTIDEGDVQMFVQFTLETPVDRATNDVREAISQIRGQLPNGILEPQVTRAIINGNAIARWSVNANDMTMEQLSWFVKNDVSRRLLAIEGMQNVKTYGDVNREIRVIVNPVKIQAIGITAGQLNQQLMAINTNSTGGRAEIAGAEQAVRIIGNAQDAYKLSQTQITLSNGRSIKLADIATVKDSYGEVRQSAKMNGRPTVAFAIFRARGASDVTIYHEAERVLAQIEKENPKVHFVKRVADVDYTIEQYHEALGAMVEGAVLAVVVVFFFLRDRRATLISALAIPLSAIPTFWVMDMMGFTLNFMTLLALSLVSGVLVDDAIVEIENIVRHMRMGKSAYQAAIDAADEIGLAVVGTTFSIVAVFFPVSIMPGVSGQFMKNFGITVVVAVLMSLLVARLITPMIAAYFLKSHGMQEHGGGIWADRYQSLLRWTLDTSTAHARKRAGKRWTAWLFDHRVWMMGISVVAFGATIIGFVSLPFTFQPEQNQDTSHVEIQMVPGTTYEQTVALTDKVAALLRSQPEVRVAVEFINVGNSEIAMTLRKDRTVTSTQFERGLAPTLNKIADARVTFASQNGGGDSSRDIAVMLAGDDPDKLVAAANLVVAQMRSLPKVVAPRVEGSIPRPEIVITPNLDMAAQMGVTTDVLSQTIRIATIGEIDQNAAKFSLSDRQIPIRVALDENSRASLSTIENLPVPTSNGSSVPLRVVANIRFGAGPSEIKRYNQERRVVLSADLTPGAIVGEERQRILDLPAMKKLPTGVHYQASGQAKIQNEMVTNFVIALISGILLVLAVLVLLYRRVVPPLVNLSSLALAPLGGVIALHICGMPNSLPTLIGLLMLLGIVAKNSILLIDFAIEEMRHGVPKDVAILDAGHKRAQPIVMTTVAMVAGMTPTALSIGGDGSFNQPMAVMVIGGLTLSTLLTLLIVPAGFSLADGLERKVGPLMSRWFTNGGDRHVREVPHAAE
jgi:multidrug efflux pump subunit AcrB